MNKTILILILVFAGFVIPVSAFIGFQPVYTPPPPPPMYVQISDSETQLCPLGTVANVTLSNNDGIYGILHSTIQDTHEITIQTGGIYHFIAAPQVGKTGQTTGAHNFWITLNGVQVDNTNVKTSLQATDSTSETIVTVLNWSANLQPNDIVVFQQSCDSDNLALQFTPASATEPATPSIILTVIKS